MNTGASWLEFDPDNAGYAAWQLHKTPLDWADTTLERLSKWGFTTIGGWSDTTTLKRSRKMLPYTLVLHIGSQAGAPWWDMWDPVIIHDIERSAKAQIEPVTDDPWLIGYYIDNELGWWNASLFRMALDQPPTSGARQRLMRILREDYNDNWSGLLEDFDPVGADGFAALDSKGNLFLRPGGNGIRTVKRFAATIADRYYQLTRDIIRKYDRGALILGDRYQSFYFPWVAKASGPYVDAVSTNWNADWSDGTFTRSYPDTLHALTGKPVMIGEYYMCAMENRTGNPNSSSSFPVVATQKDRAQSVRNSLRALASKPYLIGADWFQYYDEPPKGRSDGENYNMGLVDVRGEPYEEIAAVCRAADLDGLHARSGTRTTGVEAGVPPAPADPMAGSHIREIMKAWDRERGLVQCATPFPLADLYACWEAEALYVGVYCVFPEEGEYYREGKVPDADRMEWTLQLNSDPQPARIRMGVDADSTVGDSRVRVLHGSLTKNAAIMRIPARRLGGARLQAGQKVQFTSTLTTQARSHSMTWKADLKLVD